MKSIKPLAVITCAFAVWSNAAQAQSEPDRTILPVPQPARPLYDEPAARTAPIRDTPAE